MSFPFTRLQDLDIVGKRVLLRVAYDITLAKDSRGRLKPESDARIDVTVKTIEYLLRKNCSILLLSWLKRPGGKVVKDLRMEPIAERLAKILKRNVDVLRSVNGRDVKSYIKTMQAGDIAMLENVRFYPEENAGSVRFAKSIAALADTVVFEAFPQAHRDAASTTGLVKNAKEVCVGKFIEQEYRHLLRVREKPPHPSVAVLGGAKISDKLDAIEHMLQSMDHVLIGGALANTFLKARGVKVGRSKVESSVVTKQGKNKDYLKEAARVLKKYDGVTAKDGLPKLLLPVDLVACSASGKNAKCKTIDLTKGDIPPTWGYYDIGPKTLKEYEKAIKRAKLVFWNGPMGWFEHKGFTHGTRKVAQMIRDTKATTILGGGDTLAALDQFKISHDGYNHVSVGGGATLKFIIGEKLPALEELKKRHATLKRKSKTL